MAAKPKKMKVSSFKPAWLDESIDGTRVAMWLKPDTKDVTRASCKLCPLPNSFLITEGFKSVRQHFGTARHQKKLEESQTDPNFQQVNTTPTPSGSIIDGFARMRQKEEENLKEAEKLLRSQVKYTMASMYHNASGPFVDCQAEMFPQIFGRCPEAKGWDLRRTKFTYFATHGLYTFFHGKIVKAMRDRHFSLNFDESTVNGKSELDINASILSDDLLVSKRMLASIELTEGTDAEELTGKVLGSMESEHVDPKMCIKFTTDGCFTMLGLISGVQQRLREVIPTNPKWGGCPGHDCSNVLKSATKALDPSLTQIYSALVACLQKHSMHKQREFVRVEEWVGLEVKRCPKFIDVRFRVIERCANWMESQDRALYVYFSEMKEKILNTNYEASETEMVVLENFIGHYFEVRLSNCFLLEVSKPVIEMIDFFESEDVRIQYRHEKMVMLLYDFLSKSVRNAGVGNNNQFTGRSLLNVQYDDPKEQLSNSDIWLGKRVENLLVEAGLTRDSEEIQPWLTKVRGFYVEAISKMIKYFSEGIKSKSLQAIAVLDPKVWIDKDLDYLKKKWRILGESFSNVINVGDLPDLMTEVTRLKGMGGLEEDEHEEPDRFFSALSKIKDVNGVMEYPLLSKLGSSLCTVHNSGSPAERDFSFMNTIADSSRNNTSQLLLETKMSIKAEIGELKKKCKKCKVLNLQGKKSDHCHCSQWCPPEELMKTMRGGEPYRRYKKYMEEKAKDEADKETLKELLREEDKPKMKHDMKHEIQNLKKRARQEARDQQEAEKRGKEAKKKEEEAKKNTLFQPDKPATKRKAPGEISKAEQRRRAQRARLQ